MAFVEWLRQGIEDARSKQRRMEALREQEAVGRADRAEQRAMAAHEDPYIELGGEA